MSIRLRNPNKQANKLSENEKEQNSSQKILSVALI